MTDELSRDGIPGKKTGKNQRKAMQGKFAPLMEPRNEPGRVEFIETMFKLLDEKDPPVQMKSIPMLKSRQIDIFKLYNKVKACGGIETVYKEKLWGKLVNEMDFNIEGVSTQHATMTFK